MCGDYTTLNGCNTLVLTGPSDLPVIRSLCGDSCAITLIKGNNNLGCTKLNVTVNNGNSTGRAIHNLKLALVNHVNCNDSSSLTYGCDNTYLIGLRISLNCRNILVARVPLEDVGIGLGGSCSRKSLDGSYVTTDLGLGKRHSDVNLFALGRTANAVI